MRPKTNEKQQSQEVVRTVDQWVESAVYLGAERFEIAGALFDVRDKIGETEVRKRLSTFRGGGK